MDQKFIELLLGTVFVSVHAYDRFNTPPTNRASTTALRYHTAAVSYFSVYLLIYFLISKYPSLLGVLFVDDGSGVAKEAGSVVKTLQELSPPLLVALLLTVLLPKIPILSNLDNWLRTNLQERAAIPHEARRMSRELRNAEFKVSPNVRDKIQKIMAADGFNPENIVFDECYRPEHQWVKIAVLMAHLESEWESIAAALHPPPSALKSRTRSLDTAVSLDANESCRVSNERWASRTSLKSRRPAV